MKFPRPLAAGAIEDRRGPNTAIHIRAVRVDAVRSTSRPVSVVRRSRLTVVYDMHPVPWLPLRMESGGLNTFGVFVVEELAVGVHQLV